MKSVWTWFSLAALPLLGYPFVLVGALFWVAGVANLSEPSTRDLIGVALGGATQLLALAYPIVLAVSFFAARAAQRAGHETKALRLSAMPWLTLAATLVLALLWATIGG